MMLDTMKSGMEKRNGLEEIKDRFLADQDITPNSKITYSRILKQFFSWLESNVTPGNVTKADILNYKTNLMNAGKSANTVTSYMNVVRKFFSWLADQGIHANVATGIKGAKRSNNFKKDSLTVNQAKDLIKTIKERPGKNHREEMTNRRDYAMINLMIRTGLRTVELSRANVEDIRQEAGEAVLYIQGKGHFEKDEYVKLNHSTLAPIMEYLNARESVKGTDPLFISHANNSNGNRVTTRSIRRTVKRHMGTANISSPRITAHSLRHTAVTFVLLGKGSIQEAQTLARHKSIDTTMIYAHNIDRMKNAPENRIDTLLEGGMEA